MDSSNTRPFWEHERCRRVDESRAIYDPGRQSNLSIAGHRNPLAVSLVAECIAHVLLPSIRWALAGSLASTADFGGAPDGFRRFRFAVGMGFLSQPTGGFSLVLNGRSPLRIDVTLEDVEWASADGRLRVRYTPEQQNEEDTCGVLEIECEPSMLDSVDSWGHFEVTGQAAASQRWFGVYAVPGTVE